MTRINNFVKFLRQNLKFAVGLGILLIVILSCAAAPLITSHDPVARLSGQHEPPSVDHVLGTTQLGRDVFAQTLYGGRTSIVVGVVAAAITLFLAMVIGTCAGYFGGIVDNVIATVINIVMVIPNVPLILVMASMLGKISPIYIGLIIGLTSWAWGARVIRSQAMSIRTREFVYASETLGETKFRRLFFEVMPNMMSILSSLFVGTVIYAIMAEATLEFLGFGDPLSTTWGIMLFNAQNSAALRVGAWWELLGPCLGLILLGSGLTLINFSIDEISNPKLKVNKIMANYKRMQKKGKV